MSFPKGWPDGTGADCNKCEHQHHIFCKAPDVGFSFCDIQNKNYDCKKFSRKKSSFWKKTFVVLYNKIGTKKKR